MVMSFASRSASRIISSKDLRKTSARSRGFLPAQAAKAPFAASSAAIASSTVALATDATLFSVAGSITWKRAPSEDLRHLPPIHRSVGTLASRLSYMAMALSFHFSRARRSAKRCADSGIVSNFEGPGSAVHCYALHRIRDTQNSTLHRAFHPVDDPLNARQRKVFQNIGGRQRNMWRSDPHRRAVKVVKGFVGYDRNDLRARAAQAWILFDREQAMRARHRTENSARVQRYQRAHIYDFAVDAVFGFELLSRGNGAGHHERQCHDGGVLARPHDTCRAEAIDDLAIRHVGFDRIKRFVFEENHGIRIAHRRGEKPDHIAR